MELVCQLPEDFQKARYVLDCAREELERRLNPDRVDRSECEAARDGKVVPFETVRKPAG